ncbi:MAG: nuclear transport factor 2 family protein [Sphingomonadaceae bacterium]
MAFIGPLEDRVALHELVASYGDAVTRRDAGDWASLWADDSVWYMPEIPGMEKIQGKDAIVSTWVEAIKQFPFQLNRQLLANVTVDGDTAKGDTYTSELVKDQDDKPAHWHNLYQDEFVKREGRWLFKSRTLKILHIGAA